MKLPEALCNENERIDMKRDEGEVKDLAEKLKQGKLTKEEVLAEMKKRELYHHTGEPVPGIFAISGMIIWVVLCFFPIICVMFNLNIVDIPSIEIPGEISIIAFIFAATMIPSLFYSVHLREKRSVTGDENIVLVKTGAYGVVRHPAALCGLILFLALLIIFAVKLPFTVLSVLGEIAVIICVYLQVLHEEKINIRKWGDKYRQYVKEVPRFNFIKGLWNLRKRGN